MDTHFVAVLYVRPRTQTKSNEATFSGVAWTSSSAAQAVTHSQGPYLRIEALQRLRSKQSRGTRLSITLAVKVQGTGLGPLQKASYTCTLNELSKGFSAWLPCP